MWGKSEEAIWKILAYIDLCFKTGHQILEEPGHNPPQTTSTKNSKELNASKLPEP